MFKIMNDLPLCHKVPYKPRVVVEGQGRLGQHQKTAGDTACSVKGVLWNPRKEPNLQNDRHIEDRKLHADPLFSPV